MKKIIALLLVVVATVSLFAGCGPTGTGGGGGISGPVDAPYDVDENGQFVYGDTFKDVTVEWWFSSNYELTSDMYFFKKLEEEIGCKFEVKCYDGEQYRVKINNALQTSQLPDLCAMVVEYPVFNVYGDQGAFVNLLGDYALNRMPNMKTAVLDVPGNNELLEFYKSEDGGLYSFPRYDCERTVNFGWMYREDIFEKHGIEMWTDSESFLDVLRELKKLYPESYPLTGASMESVFNRVCNSYDFNSTVRAYDWDKKEWYLGATDEGFYDMMVVFQTAWKEGLMDPDIFTNTVDQISEAVINGTSFVYNSWIGRMISQNTYGRVSVSPDFQVSYAPHIGNGKGDELAKLGLCGTVVNAQSDSEVIDACLAIYDYLYSEEGVQTITMGEEGVTYDMVDGKKVYKKLDGSVEETPTIQTLEEQYGLWNGSTYVLASKDSVYFDYTPEEAEAQVIGAQGGFLTRAPAVTVSTADADEYSDLLTELDNEIKQYCQKFIKDGYSKAEWEASCQQWESKYARLFDILNGK